MAIILLTQGENNVLLIQSKSMGSKTTLDTFGLIGHFCWVDKIKQKTDNLLFPRRKQAIQVSDMMGVIIIFGLCLPLSVQIYFGISV